MRRWLRVLALPPWRRAPLRAWRTPSLFLGVAVAAFVLGLAGASRPMFAASTSRASLARDIETGCRFDVGLRLRRSVAVDAPEVDAGGATPLAPATEALDAAVGDISGVEPAVLTLIAGTAEIFPSADPPAPGADGRRCSSSSERGSSTTSTWSNGATATATAPASG